MRQRADCPYPTYGNATFSLTYQKSVAPTKSERAEWD